LRTVIYSLALAGLLSTSAIAAQAPATAPETKAAPAAAPATAAQITREEQLKNDWPWLGKYKENDLALAPPAAGENRVVFMGESFPGKPYINRGISGQTSPQMVLRFRQDVIDLKPKVVVILAGTNDIAENTGPMTMEESEGNLKSMVELATANHIRVVLCSVLPAFDFSWTPGKAPALKIDALNTWIKAYATEKGIVYVDYHTPMKDQRDGLSAKLSEDGVHPNPAGYAIMAPLAEAGIEKALAQ
jgi:lysophospholipase L1-like esterase